MAMLVITRWYVKKGTSWDPKIRLGTEVIDDDQAMASETPLEPGPTQSLSMKKNVDPLVM